MKRRTHILPFAIAAIITFAGLFAIAGNRYSGKQLSMHCRPQSCNNNADSIGIKK